MKPVAALLEERLLNALASQGPMASSDLQGLVGRSQPTVSRVLSGLGHQGVVKIGQGRRTRYALSRPLLGLVHGHQPLFRHGEFGEVEHWGMLTWLGNDRIQVEGKGHGWLEQGRWPWFLSPLKLEGFLGRLWARRSHLAQVLGHELDRWGLEAQLYAAITQLYDGPGAFTLGDPAGRPSASSTSVDRAERGQEYDRIASDDPYRSLAGSSAAGEQAKFLIDVRTDGGVASSWRSYLVKFSSAPRGTPFGDRWHDLLHAEALALRTLANAGGPVSQAEVLETSQRTYLESLRFDRLNRHGRRHAVALRSIHDAFLPGRPPANWVVSCNALASLGLLRAEDARMVRLWMAFGRLIGNTDMHFGNLSLWADDPARPRFELAPCYDMLPMHYQPGIQSDGFGPTPLALDRPVGEDDALWDQAHSLAEQFWAAVAANDRCTAGFRSVAAQNAERLRGLR